jgi:hypothetical protein
MAPEKVNSAGVDTNVRPTPPVRKAPVARYRSHRRRRSSPSFLPATTGPTPTAMAMTFNSCSQEQCQSREQSRRQEASPERYARGNSLGPPKEQSQDGGSDNEVNEQLSRCCRTATVTPRHGYSTRRLGLRWELTEKPPGEGTRCTVPPCPPEVTEPASTIVGSAAQRLERLAWNRKDPTRTAGCRPRALSGRQAGSRR